MKIAVLYIATGRYSIFWDDFYTSCENYFLKKHEKTYFVFTDDENIKDKENIRKIYQKKLGWPYDTMMRFDMFLTLEKELIDYDYIFFFNANTKFLSDVNEEILPDEVHDGLVTASHHAFYDKNPDDYTYDRNPLSTAYIPFGEGSHYATGALNGGISKNYLDMCKKCSENDHTDLDNNVIALWHDESHLNKYLLDKNPLIMPVNYLYPETSKKRSKWNKPNEFSKDIKILSVDKTKPQYGGHDYLRGAENNSFLKNIFSIYDSTKGNHKILRIFGLKISFKSPK